MKLTTFWNAYLRANKLSIEAEKNFLHNLNNSEMADELMYEATNSYMRRMRQKEKFLLRINYLIMQDAELENTLDNLFFNIIGNTQERFDEWLKKGDDNE